ncbi:MAG TPA: TerC family protein [Bryobacteraceae bacterium]|nr:TerC family protein [Bryobacteraceae bacterium]
MPPGSLPHLFLDCLSIILIDLLLAGDNALVIALAARSLPPRQRRLGIVFGAATAVVLRVALTIAAAQLLNVEWIKLVGGAFVIWIAVKVLADASSPEATAHAPGKLFRAIWYIAMADITMSTDNVLAIAGASKGSVPLIILGLGLSIPFVMFSANLIVLLMDRYPWTLYLGAAILGKVGGEMMMTDSVVMRTLHPSQTMTYIVEALAIIGILIAGRIRSASARNAALIASKN